MMRKWVKRRYGVPGHTARSVRAGSLYFEDQWQMFKIKFTLTALRINYVYGYIYSFGAMF